MDQRIRIAISSDEYHPILDTLIDEVKRWGDVIYFGPKKNEDPQDWPDVTLKAAKAVSEGKADEAIILCWTGTGCSIIANKVKGIRAALCVDAETAKGARIWNHANVLALSLRLTSEPQLKEILEMWFTTPYSEDRWNINQINKVKEYD